MQITFSGNVEWRSPGGNLVQFEDSGEATASGTSVTLSPLIPGTMYVIKVSTVSLRGRGEEVSISGNVNFHQGMYKHFIFQYIQAK